MGHTLSLEWHAVWKVLVWGLVLGAGLPAIFALGIRSLAFGTGGEAEVHASGAAAAQPHPIGRVLAGLCFLVVIVAVVLGLTIIISTGFGKTVSFQHVYPTFSSK